MDITAVASRSFAKAKFKILGRATIIDIPTERFESLKLELNREGWRLSPFFRVFGVFVDHDNMTFWRRGRRLKLEWDNWTEGSVEGSKSTVQRIAARDDSFKIVNYWRWSIYD